MEKNKPEWWEESEEIKEQLGLPPYKPPRFNDEVYTYEIVERLEEEYECSIRFLAEDPRYPDDWIVEVNDEAAFTIGRRRDRDGNTVFECPSKQFEEKVREALDRDEH